MLTKVQLGVIEGLPVEGSRSYSYGIQAMVFPPSDIAAAVDASFKDKIAPAKKRAIIMTGSPGVGKTREARNLYEQLSAADKAGTIYVAKNEGGAEDNFAPFMAALYAAEGNKEKIETANRFMPVIGRIASDTYKRALIGEYSLIIDISGIGHDVKDLAGTLRKVGYEDIEIRSIHSSFAIAKGRAEERIWPTDSFNLVSKRITALESLPAQPQLCDHFTFLTNNMLTIDAREVFSIDCSARPVIANKEALHKVSDDLITDMHDIRTHLKDLRKDRAYKERVNVDAMMTAYDRAVNGAIKFLEDTANIGEVSPREVTVRRILAR